MRNQNKDLREENLKLKEIILGEEEKWKQITTNLQAKSSMLKQNKILVEELKVKEQNLMNEKDEMYQRFLRIYQENK